MPCEDPLNGRSIPALQLPYSDPPQLSKLIFTITAEIHECSLANFYGQYVDAHMNFKFMGRVGERARAIRQFIIVKNKSLSV